VLAHKDTSDAVFDTVHAARQCRGPRPSHPVPLEVFEECDDIRWMEPLHINVFDAVDKFPVPAAHLKPRQDSSQCVSQMHVS
jgi:hypothetical protein